MTFSHLPHRIGDLETTLNMMPSVRKLPHRIGDLESYHLAAHILLALPHRIGDLEMRLKARLYTV